jgi:ferritin-like metal-binding protein YciE
VQAGNHPGGDERTPMDDPRELFIHELGDVLYAERVLVKTLPKLIDEATDTDLKSAFERHLSETETHVENVEAAFESIGEKAKAEKCPGIEGLKTEHDEFVSKEKPSSDVLDMFLTGAGARTEHYEIAAYTGLVTMAEALGEAKAAELLQSNLEQEQAALKKLTTIGGRLATTALATA